METYNYMKEMKEDIKEYIKNEITLQDYSDRNELYEHLNDILWAEDSITGNGSGSYTFNCYQAEEYICHNMELLAEACEEFACTADIGKGAEWCDVTIRCYLLPQAVDAALDDMEAEIEKVFEGTEISEGHEGPDCIGGNSPVKENPAERHQQIRADIRTNGFKATRTLVNAIGRLDAATGRHNTLRDVKELTKSQDMSADTKEAVGEIVETLQQQEEKLQAPEPPAVEPV